MFERFTERARQVVVLAQEEARVLKHNYIGTEHILLGLLREAEGIAALVLTDLGLSAEAVRADIVKIVGSGEEVTSGQIPFTPRAKKVLELALREALSLRHNYIGTEHILLGLVRENEGVAARVLLDFGADSETVRNQVIRVLSGVETLGPSPALAEIGLSDTLLDGADAPLRTLVDELEAELGRPADAGDLLVLLASVPDGIGQRTLAALGIGADALARGVADARGANGRSSLLPPPTLLAEYEAVRAERIDAIKAEERARAKDLRDRERQLVDEALRSIEAHQEELLSAMRTRLGITKP